MVVLKVNDGSALGNYGCALSNDGSALSKIAVI